MKKINVYKTKGKAARKPGDLIEAFKKEVGKQKGAKANRFGLLSKKGKMSKKKLALAI